MIIYSDGFQYTIPSRFFFFFFSQYGGNSNLYFTNRPPPNHEMLTGFLYGSDPEESIIDLMFIEAGSGDVGARLIETQLTSKRSVEAGFVLLIWFLV